VTAAFFLAEISKTTGYVPYALAIMSVLAAVLYFAFATDGVVSGSFVYMVFGSYFAPLIVAGLIGWGLYSSLPSIAVSYTFRLADWSYHDTGVYVAIGFAVLCFLGFVGKVRKTRMRAARRGGLN
jgi:hypothetical protein